MTDGEQNSAANTGEKNWKELREKNEFLEGRLAEFEAKEKVQIFKDAGLDTSTGVGKAVEKLYEGEMNVENIQKYASEEFGVEFGQQDGIQSEVIEVEESQTRLQQIQKSSVVDSFNQDDLTEAINKAAAEGDVKNSISLKLAALEEEKNSKK